MIRLILTQVIGIIVCIKCDEITCIVVSDVKTNAKADAVVNGKRKKGGRGEYW